jgi:aryl-alcohol dehydrogenase-like predicted oxidoreductase
MTTSNKTNEAALGGRFTFPGTSLTVHWMGYGVMQLAGPGVYGPPKDPDAAVALLREAVAAGVNHIDSADYYARTSPTRSSGRPCTHIPRVWCSSRSWARRPVDKSWQPAISPQELCDGVHDNLRNPGLDTLDIVNYRALGRGY